MENLWRKRMKSSTDRLMRKNQDDILAPNIEYYSIQMQIFRLKEIKMKQPLISLRCDPAMGLEREIFPHLFLS